MEELGGESGQHGDSMLKRKRSQSAERPQISAPPAKLSKTLPGASIDFLAPVQNEETLPLVDIDDSLRFILQQLEQYSGVFERHESLAANLGAKLRAPNNIKRFERLFEHPIKILANHGKEGNLVTWLDIVKFYEDKPSQFRLNQKDGETVCQFYTKQCRIEIHEDDYEFIKSGQPQKMLPSGTASHDEERELGTIEFMETRVTQILKLVDQVCVRGKQLLSRLKARKNALAAKRDVEVNGRSTAGPEGIYSEQRSTSPVSGFTAVNAQSRDSVMTNGIPTTSSVSKPLVSGLVKQELQQMFNSNRERIATGPSEISTGRPAKSRARLTDVDYTSGMPSHASLAQPSTPSYAPSVIHRPSPAEKLDNDGPHKAEMLSRMEKMARYTVVKPPCDRCRRLQMDCQKNLTACLGCTRKHAKCSWKDVTDQELRDNPAPTGPVIEPSSERRGSLSGSQGGSEDIQAESGPPLPVRDEELLGEDDSEDEAPPATTAAAAAPVSYAPQPHAAQQPQDDKTNEIAGAAQPSPSLPSMSHSSVPPAASVGFTPANTTIVTSAVSTSPLSPASTDSGQNLPPRFIHTQNAVVRPATSTVSYENNMHHGSHASYGLNHSHGISHTNDHSTHNNTHSNQYAINYQSAREQDNIKLESSSQNSATSRYTNTFSDILGGRMIDNPALLGTATGNRLAREAQENIERMAQQGGSEQQQRDGRDASGMHGRGHGHGHSHQPGFPNGVTKV